MVGRVLDDCQQALARDGATVPALILKAAAGIHFRLFIPLDVSISKSLESV